MNEGKAISFHYQADTNKIKFDPARDEGFFDPDEKWEEEFELRNATITPDAGDRSATTSRDSKSGGNWIRIATILADGTAKQFEDIPLPVHGGQKEPIRLPGAVKVGEVKR
jgi:hypothetical protein